MVSVLLSITGIIFLGMSVFNAIKNNNIISKLSTVIFTIAGSTYLLMSCLHSLGNEIPIRILRYIDWFLTVPLMIIQMSYFFSGKNNIKKVVTPILITLLMLFFGLLGEIGFKENWPFVSEGQIFDLRINEFKTVCGMIATGFMSQLFIKLSGNLDQTKVKLFTRVLLLWCFYPTVYFISESLTTLILFSIVDLTAKVGIGFVMHSEYENKRT